MLLFFGIFVIVALIHGELLGIGAHGHSLLMHLKDLLVATVIWLLTEL